MYMVNQGKYYASLLLLLRYMSIFTIMYHMLVLLAQQRSALNHHTVVSLEVFVIINFDQDKPAFRQKSVSWKLMTIMSVPLPRQNITPIRNQKKNQIKAQKI